MKTKLLCKIQRKMQIRNVIMQYVDRDICNRFTASRVGVAGLLGIVVRCAIPVVCGNY